jgi:hypothetical protein
MMYILIWPSLYVLSVHFPTPPKPVGLHPTNFRRRTLYYMHKSFCIFKKKSEIGFESFFSEFCLDFFSETYYFENNYVKTRSVASSEYCKFIDVERFGDFHFDIFRSRLLYAAVEFFDT